MKQLEADLAVIAAGPAGLAAAVAAAESGVSVAVFEKSAVTGGASNMGMGPFAVESHIQQEMMEKLTLDDAFAEFMEANHWHVDAQLVRAYFAKSADTIRWLEEMGVEFYGAMKYFPSAHRTWHVVQPEGGGKPGPRCAGTMTKRMTERAQELGARIYLETPVTKILTEDGRPCGVVAKNAQGEEITCRSKAVVVATGGFGFNKEMIKEETGYTYGEDFYNIRVPGIMGDGLKMAWEAGAGRSRIMMEKIFEIQGHSEHPEISAAGYLFKQPSLLAVNRLGERVMNEEFMEHTAYTANVIDIQPGRYIYTILDSGLLKHFRRKGMDVPSMVHQGDALEALEPALEGCRSKGLDTILEADSLEELAEKIGCRPQALQETVEAYNRDCERNYDSLFNKSRRRLHALKKPKFYAAKFFISAYGSLGGIKINHKTEVMDDSWQVIPGFYAAGNDACTIYSGTYIFQFPGNTMGFAVNSGRIAGEQAAEYLQSL